MRITILGSTGSIGRAALEVVEAHPDKLEVYGLAAGSRGELLADQARRFGAAVVAIGTPQGEESYARAARGVEAEILSGSEGVKELARRSSADVVLNSMVGASGLEPTLAALEDGISVALANKESIVIAGDLVTAAARRSGARLIPVDSEPSAIYQCLKGRSTDDVSRLILTASGGALRHLSKDELEHAEVEDALRHPTWKMGPKVTIDSATLMNKGLELIEAHWFFNMPYSRLDVLIHPQSVVHSLVEFKDGSIIAHMGSADMRIPIQYALSDPSRWESPANPCRLEEIHRLDFEDPDPDRFPCLSLARQAGEEGGTAPAALSAADEVAVTAALEGRLRLSDIPRVVGEVMSRHRGVDEPGLEAIKETDRWARDLAEDFVTRRGRTPERKAL